MSDETVIRPDTFQSKVIPTAPRDCVIAPAQVLNAAAQNDSLEQVLVIGLLSDRRLFAASSHPHIADNILLVDRFRQHVMGQFSGDRFG